MSAGRPLIDIVLAEDDDGHAELIMDNLRGTGVVNRIVRVCDGQELLDYIRHEGAPAGQKHPNPIIILLDIKMPRVDGVEALEQLKADPRHRQIPVIMLTTADNPREVELCYGLKCNAYVTKPVEYRDFIGCIRKLGMFAEIINVPPADRKDT